MAQQPHVIGRQVLEIALESERDAFSLQQELAELFQTRVVPAMGAVFDRCAPGEGVLRLGRIEIDFGRLPRDRLDETLAARVCEALEARLATHLYENPMARKEELAEARTEVLAEGREVRLSRDEHVLALWHFVLRHGYLPWWAPPASAAGLEARVLEALQSLAKLPTTTERLLRDHDVAIERLVQQGGGALLERVLRLASAAVAAVSLPVIESLARWIESQPIEALRADVLRRHVWRAALEESLRPTASDPPARLRAMLRAALKRSARSASMAYDELLSQLRTWLQPAGSRSAPAIPAETREALLAALAGVAEDEPPRAAKAGVAEDEPPTAAKDAHGVPESRTQRKRPEAEVLDRRGERAIDAGEREPPGGEARADGEFRPRDSAVESVDGDARAVERRDRPVTSAPAFGELVEPLARDAPAPRDLSRLTAETPRHATVSEGDVLFVDDAGIVLLNPFLAVHFEKLGLQRDGAFLDGEARERAVQQLRYLATGEQEAPEPLLAFAKILCGLTPAVPIARSAPLGESAKSEAEVLLREVIRHWGALKNASPDGLRETFLRREGRLERKDDGWKIRVESRGYDILLNRLPWSMGVVRLPWMADLIFVEWGS